MKYLGSLQVPSLGSPPSSPVAGQIYFNSADKVFYGWGGTAWVPLRPDGGNAATLGGKSASDLMPKGPLTWNQLKGV
ncbi:hypothetical protein EDD73_108136 [Heliophilum fasciatum]|uniref:Uncharacterized protein n=1 Tax=Heliophilum fasciatum TaxID=35700 RepID=A0A4R2RNM2_9FIRM|nr:hypothetical protein [Heliophilum fasciatum]TCP64783.1 hypothetical protein EDD73_108136 [Heliophilum fasciatum]